MTEQEKREREAKLYERIADYAKSIEAAADRRDSIAVAAGAITVLKYIGAIELGELR